MRTRLATRLIAVCIPVAAILASQPCQAQYRTPGPNQLENHKRASEMLASQFPVKAKPAAASSTAVPAADMEPFLFKAVYFIPRNRTPQPSAILKMKKYIKIVQRYYSMEMAKSGFYKPGTTEGKTFTYEADENGEPIIHILNGDYDDSYYGDGFGEFYAVSYEVGRVYDRTHSSYIVWTEACRINPDSTISGPVCLGGFPSDTGGYGGMAMLGSDSFPFLDWELFPDPTPIDGLIYPELGPYPLKHGVSYGGFANPTIGGYASTCHGATAHEIGHSFSLPHCFVRDEAPRIGGELMGRGNQGFRGNFGDFPGEFAVIDKWNCEMLAVSRYFNPGEPHTDWSGPYHDDDITVSDGLSTANKKVHIKVHADDYGGSALWRAIAIVTQPWTTSASASFDENNNSEFWVTPADVPYEELKPEHYTFEIKCLDMQGNGTTRPTWVQIPTSMIQQFKLNGTTWAGTAAGTWCGSQDLKLQVSLYGHYTNNDVYPEFEIQPVGTPFTGSPNYTGTGGKYLGDPAKYDLPITGLCEIHVPTPGKYHWRYRVASNWERSAWMSMGNDDPSVMDIGVDITAPTTPVVIDDGDYTNTNTSIKVTWNTEDPESGMKFAMVNVGTSPTDPGSGYLAKWTTITGANTATITGLNLVEGTTYYVYVRSRNNANLQSITGVSNGIRYTTATPKTINQAKGCTDTTRVRIDSVVASTAKSDFSGYFYVQNKDRSAGIRVNYQGSVDFTAGKVMSIVGTLATVDGEKVINATDVMLAGEDRQIRPVAMNARTIGGGKTGLQEAVWSKHWVKLSDGTKELQWKSASSLSNIGLLVKVFGKVTQIDPSGLYFYIDDGSGLRDGTKTGDEENIGVKIAANGSTYTKGQFVSITGLVSCGTGADSKLVRVIRIRKSGDIVPVN